jgi:hypothetical protein
LKSVVAESHGHRTTIRFGDLTVGSFHGAWEFTFFKNSPLVQIEAVAATEELSAAVVYDLGLVGFKHSDCHLLWREPRGGKRAEALDPKELDASEAVQGRALAVECRDFGSLAIFPSPHQFFFPRDYTDNLSVVWHGRNHAGFSDPYGIGVRQAKTGGGNFVPWCNAPPGTQQRFGMFLRVAREAGAANLQEVAKYTRGDRFEPLPSQTTFTSHYHMAIAEQAMRRRTEGRETEIPEFVDVFKQMGVQIVHLGEFHGDGHPKDL